MENYNDMADDMTDDYTDKSADEYVDFNADDSVDGNTDENDDENVDDSVDDSADDNADYNVDFNADDSVDDNTDDNDDDNADDNVNLNANDNVDIADENASKYISITKIKYTGTKETGNVKELVKTFLEDNLKIGGTLEPLTEIEKNGRKIFTITRNVKKESKQAGEKDKNHGELCFVYWKSTVNDDVNIYCLANTGRSGAWTYLRPIRDFSFPRKFAKTFLNSRNIRTVEVNYLSNTNDSSTVSLSFEKGKFESYEIMDQYGIVKSFSAPIDNRTQQGSELLKMLMTSSLGNNPIKVQKGQIRLPLFVTKKERKISPEHHIDMLLLINENISCEKGSCCTDQDWKFYDYIQPIFDKNKINNLENYLNEKCFDYLSDKESNQELPVNSKLTYVHQDCFDAGEIELLHNGKKVFKKPIKGEYLTLSDILDHIEGIKFYEPNDLNKVKLQFYDWVENNYVSKPFLEMVQCQLIVPVGNEMVPAFKFNGNWYLVELDSRFDIITNFVDVVKKCLKNVNDGVEFPEVLPWSHKAEAKNKTSKTGSVFSMDVLYDFCYEFKMEPEEREKEIAKLEDILTKTTHLLIDQNNGVMRQTDLDGEKVLTYKNNFLRGVDLEDPLSQSSKHSLELLSLNTCIFKQRKDPLPKDLQESLTNKDSFEIEETRRKSLEFCLKGLQTLGKLKGKFRVYTPYLSIDIWKEIDEAGINICPVRLVQFLRMWWTHLDEGDYNELYHLSNCKCRRQNHDFIYVVGDRIFDNENHQIELFDVMAINLKAKTFYMLHVKSGFSGESARDMCSQVRVCGQMLWRSLSTKTYNRTMLQKFYAVAMKHSPLVHETLTKNEIAMIGKSEEEFLEAMMYGDVKYHVCAAPCLLENRFSSVLNTNLKYEFKEKDFDDSRIFFALKETGIIDKIKKTINPIIFDKSKFLQTIAKKISKGEQVYKDIFKIIAGGERDPLINPRFSLIAKIMFVDLYKKFNNFGASVQLCIIVVPPLKSKVSAAIEHNNPSKTQLAAYATQNKEQQQSIVNPEVPTIQSKLSFQAATNLKRKNVDRIKKESKNVIHSKKPKTDDK